MAIPAVCGWKDELDLIAHRLERLGIEGLIYVGGDGTLNGLQPLAERLPTVLAPKTIDNVVIVCGEGIVDEQGRALGAETETTDPAGNSPHSDSAEYKRPSLNVCKFPFLEFSRHRADDGRGLQRKEIDNCGNTHNTFYDT